MADAEQELYDRLLLAQKLVPSAPIETPIGTPDSSKPVTLRNLFTHPDSHPVVLDFALQKQFGLEWLRWEAETIWDEVQKEFGTQLSELCRQKIYAIQTIHTSLAPWASWVVFEKVANVFNGILPNFKIVQIVSVPELYAAVDILDFLKKEKFRDEVKLYMAATVLHDDIFFVPPPLDIIQLEVSQPSYHCKDCGNEEPALFHDGLCSNCTQRMAPEQMLTMQPKQDLINVGKGKNVEVTIKYDPIPIAKRWEEVKAKPFSEFVADEDKMEDVQVRQLLVARDYMNLRRRQLTEQLTSLRSWLGTV